MNQSEEILALNSVSKRFPGVLALDNVSFSLRRGEAHALCGENGAGKSTLMKVMSGVYQADEGELVYKGKVCSFGSSVDAEAAGIAIIHQELNLIPHLSVAENIFLAREPVRGFFIDRKKMRVDAQALLDRLKLRIDPRQLVKNLSCAQQQMVEIAKALSLNTEVLIMDEPTSSLTESETGQLFEIINELKRNGVSVVYISHRLEEMQHIIDRVTVLRDGKFVSTDDFHAISLDAIVAKMVGRTLDEKFPERFSTPTGDVLLRVTDLHRKDVFGPLSFDLKRGEILGFSGLMGAGRTEVARAIFGADPLTSGAIHLGDTEVVIDSPIDAIDHGIAYLSEDRKSHGLAIRMSVAANLTLTNVSALSNRFGFIDFAKEEAVAKKYIAALGIKTPTSKQIARNLSGGNQQKVLLAKWMFAEPDIMILDEPTRGIDVGAKYEIYCIINDLVAAGKSVVMISSEMPEVLGMCDRIYVMSQGKIVGEMDAKSATQERIMSSILSVNKGA